MDDENLLKNTETKTESQENATENKPDEKPKKSTEEIRQEKWDTVSNDIEHTTDRIGCSIDEKIKETVIALNVFDINTSQSCEGHHDEMGAGTPWVEIEAPNEPAEVYNGQKEIIFRTAEENNITVEDLRCEEKYEQIYMEAMTKCAENGETKEIIAWQEENKKLRMTMEEIVSDFYKDRNVSEDVKMKFRDIGGWDAFRIVAGTDEDYDRDFEKMTEKEKEKLGKRLEGYRKEMDDFTSFLKDKFFKEGESYVNEIKKKVQEKLDQNKIEELRDKINGGEKIDWKQFWKKEGLNTPLRKEVFPHNEDVHMSDEETVDALNKYLEERGSSFNMTGIDSEEYPEIIDADIRDVCLKLNKLTFLKTKEGCGGHETRNGEIFEVGYSEPYLGFYINRNDPDSNLFLQRLGKELEEFKKLNLPGIENIVLVSAEDATETENVEFLSRKMRLVPTKEWCKKSGKKYIERPEELGRFDEWCRDNSYEYSEDEESESRKKWEKAKSKYRKEINKFREEYSDYFRSEEARRLRDGFFEVFENSISAENEDIIQKTKQHLEIIKSSLRDFSRRVATEQPDVLVFMDRGARIFGTPIKEYLKTLNMSKIPEVRYYNDDDLKEAYIKNLDTQKIIESDLGDLRGKKVFFLDETYFSGKGAAVLKKAKDYLENDNIFYFALTTDPNEKAKKDEIDEWDKYYELPIKEHKKMIQEIKNDKNFVIYDNKISQLFSRLAAKLYTDQIKSNGRTTTVHLGSKRLDSLLEQESKKKEKKIPKKEDLESVAKIKKMIFNTLI